MLYYRTFREPIMLGVGALMYEYVASASPSIIMEESKYRIKFLSRRVVRTYDRATGRLGHDSIERPSLRRTTLTSILQPP